METIKRVESIFVETFVLRNKRKRSLFELTSKKKRSDFFKKLCHRYRDIIDSRNMVKISTPNSSSREIFKILIEEGAGRDCYVISCFEDLDKRRIPLENALDNCVGRGMPSIVICNPYQLAYFEAEQEIGPPPRFILKMK